MDNSLDGTSRSRRTWTRSDADATRRRVLLLHQAGMPVAEIARVLGVHRVTVSRAVAWYRKQLGCDVAILANSYR